MKWLHASTIACMTAAIGAPGHAKADAIISGELGSLLSSYGLVVLNDMGSSTTPYSSDSWGPIAVGGNAYLSSFGAGIPDQTYARPIMTVGGNLTATNAQFNGNISVAGSANLGSSGGGFYVGGSAIVGKDATMTNGSLAGNLAVGGDAALGSASNGIFVGGNATVGHNLTIQNGAVAGNAAVGGNATLGAPNAGAGIQGNLTVGGTVAEVNGGVGGTTTAGSSTVTAPATPAPLDFAAMFANLDQTSMQLAATAANGTVTDSCGPGQASGCMLSLTGVNQAINYFDITGAQLGALNSGLLSLAAPSQSWTVINVSGSDVSFGAPGNFSFVYNGVVSGSYADHVLFNFSDATLLDIGSVDGSILAPLATVSYSNGRLDGALIASSLQSPAEYSGGELDDPRFRVPEPRALAVLAIAVAGLMVARQRKTRAPLS